MRKWDEGNITGMNKEDEEKKNSWDSSEKNGIKVKRAVELMESANRVMKNSLKHHNSRLEIADAVHAMARGGE